jgi:hypothetical protein
MLRGGSLGPRDLWRGPYKPGVIGRALLGHGGFNAQLSLSSAAGQFQCRGEGGVVERDPLARQSRSTSMVSAIASSPAGE